MVAILDRMTNELDNDERRVRLIADADDLINSAVQLRASKLAVARKRKVTKSEVIIEILRAALAAEIAEIQSFSEPEVPPKAKKR
jgi:hypothetical protein